MNSTDLHALFTPLTFPLINGNSKSHREMRPFFTASQSRCSVGADDASADSIRDADGARQGYVELSSWRNEWTERQNEDLRPTCRLDGPGIRGQWRGARLYPNILIIRRRRRGLLLRVFLYPSK
jgi:hypothetical protein